MSCSCVNLHNQQHVLVMCAVAFYMMENYPLDVGAEFMAGIIQVNILCVNVGCNMTFTLILLSVHYREVNKFHFFTQMNWHSSDFLATCFHIEYI